VETVFPPYSVCEMIGFTRRFCVTDRCSAGDRTKVELVPGLLSQN